MKIQVRVISGKKRPLPGSLHTVVRLLVKNKLPMSNKLQGRVIPEKKEAPARKPTHSRPSFGKKPILPKVEFGSNDLSGIEATCLLTPPATPKST